MRLTLTPPERLLTRSSTGTLPAVGGVFGHAPVLVLQPLLVFVIEVVSCASCATDLMELDSCFRCCRLARATLLCLAMLKLVAVDVAISRLPQRILCCSCAPIRSLALLLLASKDEIVTGVSTM